MVQLLNNVIRHSGLSFPLGCWRLLLDSSPHGCKMATVTPRFHFIAQPRRGVTMPAFHEESRASWELRLADLCLHFLVTRALPAGWKPGNVRDRSIKIGLDQGRQVFSVRGRRANISGFAGRAVCGNHAVLPFWHGSHRRQCLNDRAWLYSNNTFFMDTEI